MTDNDDRAGERLAVLFPGQGSQRVGMGSQLRATDRVLFDRHLGLAEDIAGLPIRRLCLEGPAEALTRTDASQPAIFALSLAVAELARTMGAEPAFVAGHSLGEYTAAVFAGALGMEEGMALVARRGRLMAELQRERPGAMAAVIGASAAAVARWCEAAGDVTVANHNTPTQTVVAGEGNAVERLSELAREHGARAIRLPVGGAFHTARMEPARVELAEAAAGLSWRDPRMPLAANVSGEAVFTADAVRDSLLRQVTSPVRWVDCVRTLADAGCGRFLELGPGRVLTRLVTAIHPVADAAAAESRQELVKHLWRSGRVAIA